MNNMLKGGEAHAPFTREEIIVETRKAALAVASLISWFGPNDTALRLAQDYLGVAFETYDLEAPSEQELSSIPIEKHFLYRVVMDAYDYAYQVGASLAVPVEERMHEASAILTSFPQTDFNGEPSPLDKLNPQKLRQVLETFLARHSLDMGRDLSIRELALLANMGEAAVRTSLSKEGITTIGRQKGQYGVVAHSQALPWLLGRRGFVPTAKLSEEDLRKEERAILGTFLRGDTVTFPRILEFALRINALTLETLAERADVPTEWLQKVLSDQEAIDVDLNAIIRIANALDVPVPIFAARAVEHLLNQSSSGTLR